MVIKSVSSVSMARIMGCFFAVFGLLAACAMCLIELAIRGGYFEATPSPTPLPPPAVLMMVIAAPPSWGACGYVVGIVVALLFNAFASIVGGLEVGLQNSAPSEGE